MDLHWWGLKYIFSGVQTMFEVLFDTKDTDEGKHWIQNDWMLFCVTWIQTTWIRCLCFSLFSQSGLQPNSFVHMFSCFGTVGGLWKVTVGSYSWVWLLLKRSVIPLSHAGMPALLLRDSSCRLVNHTAHWSVNNRLQSSVYDILNAMRYISLLYCES